MAEPSSSAPARRHPERLPATVRAFHWASVALVAAMFALIWTAGWLGPDSTASALVNLHRSVGLTLFTVVVARLAWRSMHPIPSLPVPRWESLLAGGVQAALYACLIAMPLLGWAASDMAGDTVQPFGLFTLPSVLPLDEDWSDTLFAIHEWVAWTLLGLAALHIAGALRHRFVKHDGVLERML